MHAGGRSVSITCRLIPFEKDAALPLRSQYGPLCKTEKSLSFFFLFFFFFCGEGPRSRCYGGTAAFRLIVQPCDEDDIFFFSFFRVMELRWLEIDSGKLKYSVKICPSATLSTTKPTWT
jgi:hypothetical protein